MKIYKCKKCGNIIVTIKERCDMLSCCNEGMIELKANSVDAAIEKHVPIVEINDNIVTAVCGEAIHPMTEEHFIEFMLMETNNGYNIQYLNPGDEPKCTFILSADEELKAVYAYCNLHGLWVNNK